MLLLLLVWGVSFWFFFSPPGDPDFSQFMYWYEDLSEAEDFYAAYELAPFTSVITWDNVVYCFSAVMYAFFLILTGMYYFVLYVCDTRDVPLSHAPKIYFTRVWWMILWGMVAFFPCLMIFSLLPFCFLVFIPALYALPGLVFFEKQNSFVGTGLSFQKTFGHKLSILLEITLILLLASIINRIVTAILKEGSVGLALVTSFVTAYFSLVVARNVGIRYQMITILEKE